MLKEFDELKKHIKSKEGLELAKKFRKQLKKSEEYANKLDCYFMHTINGAEPEIAKQENGL
jgi:hydroxypyruvate isomerase